LGEKGKSFGSVSISASGKWIAFQHGSSSFLDIPEMAVMPLQGGSQNMISIPFDRNKSNFVWSQDDKYIYFTPASHGDAPLYRVDVQNKKTEQLSDFNSGTGSFDIRGNHLIYVRTAVDDPFELYAADASMKNTKRISTFNEGWIRNRELSMPEKHEFK